MNKLFIIISLSLLSVTSFATPINSSAVICEESKCDGGKEEKKCECDDKEDCSCEDKTESKCEEGKCGKGKCE